jgi:conjugative relaxase-like TrwC/TraI family protein
MHQGCLVGRARPGVGEPVLSIAKLRVHAEGYYLDLVASGADEYYSERGEVPGRWVGTGLDPLGLSGHVLGEDLRAVLAAHHPRSGDALSAALRKVPGFDLTFSAPKSVSLLFALGDRELAVEALAAHDLAVESALGYLEREACVVRRGHAGARQVRADGFVGAAFRHRTSRPGDPQLHTHVLVANLARGIDGGGWGALDARLLYRQLRTAGYLYQAALRYELTSRVGVAWGSVVRGSADLDGIPKHILKAFSRRRADIERELSQHGATSRRAAHIATLVTRQPKGHDASPAVVRAEWRQRAGALGLQRDDVLALVGRVLVSERLALDERELSEVLTLETVSFDRRDVLRAIAERALAGVTVDALTAHADQFLTGRFPVRLTENLYTTQQMLSLEASVLANAQDRLGAGVGRVTREVLESILASRVGLSREQARMVEHVTRSGHGVDVVLGSAGAGKTQALQAAHAAWQQSGHRTVGVALAARAATELQDRAGIPSDPLDALLCELDQSSHLIAPGAVIVVDEAGMVGTRKLARLLAHADAVNAKVVLVGDPRQLPEIDAGGVLVALARRLPVARLTENRRQVDPVDRQALVELRAGDADAAVRRLVAHGRVTITDSADAVRRKMVEDWLVARRHGEDPVMLAARRADVDELNRLARAELVSAGEVQPGGLTVHGRTFAVGDRVMTLSNRRQLGVVNGARGTVTTINATSIAVALDRGTTIDLPVEYVRGGHLGHAYATTIHKAQGLTCDRALLFANGALFREAGYTALSRGRLENHLYLSHPELAPTDVGHGIRAAKADAIKELVSSLESSRRKDLAFELAAGRPAAAHPRLAEPSPPGLGIDL